MPKAKRSKTQVEEVQAQAQVESKVETMSQTQNQQKVPLQRVFSFKEFLDLAKQRKPVIYTSQQSPRGINVQVRWSVFRNDIEFVLSKMNPATKQWQSFTIPATMIKQVIKALQSLVTALEKNGYKFTELAPEEYV